MLALINSMCGKVLRPVLLHICFYVWEGENQSLHKLTKVCVWERETRLPVFNKISVCVGRENRVLAIINTMCVLEEET